MVQQKLLKDILNKGANNFDLFRLIAAMGVIVGHSYAIAPQPPLQDGVLSILNFDYSGSLAVKFFFFLSGLLVTNSIISRPDPFQFLAKRALRIFPGLLVCLLISVLIVGPIFTKLSIGEYFTAQDTWKYLVKNFFLTDIIWRLPGVFEQSKYGLNGSLWTLPYEVLCYLYLAAFFGLGLLRKKIIANIFFLLVIAAAFIAPNYLPVFFFQNPEAHLLTVCFAMGALLANNKENIRIGLVEVVLLWLLMFLFKSSAIYQLLFYAAFFYTTVYIASLEFVNRFRLPFDASYGVYVYGFMIQQCVHALFPAMGVHGNQVLSAIIALGIGILSWKFVEKRFIDWGHQIFSKDFKGVLKTGALSLRNLFPRLGQGPLTWRKNLYYFIIFALLAIIVHAIVLKFIFPGYYKPLTPHHSDFYIPAAFANAPNETYYTFLGFLTWPRPIYLMVCKFIGYFGIQGGIAWIIMIVCMNAALSALLIKRFLKLSFSWSLIIIFLGYCLLLFSHPYFYTFYSQDLGAQLSYFFLIIGVHFFYSTYNRSVILSNSLLLFFGLLAFLSKETYGLTALFFTLLWFVYYKKTSFLKAFLPFLMISIAFITAFTVNVLIKSIFVDLNAAPGGDYHISFNPSIILREWFKYASEAMNLANVAMLGLLTYLVFIYKGENRKQLVYLIVACLSGVVLSLIPNAVLPNHHYKGYSFNGTYILYLCLFFLPILWKEELMRRGVIIVIALLTLISPLVNTGKYKGDVNTWVLIQENNQRNLLAALGPLMKGLNKSAVPQKVLIQGITFPFHPFVYPESVRVFPNSKYGVFDVVNYNPSVQNNVRNDLVAFLKPSDTSLITYDQKWTFDNEGRLTKLENFLAERILTIKPDSNNLITINAENLSQYSNIGFYDAENLIRWTNGQAMIDLKTPIENKDSVVIRLNTYMPPICKNVVPKIFLSDINNKRYEAALYTRKDDVFYYLFVRNKERKIQKINISSEIIDASPDKRTLSFPFVSLDINAY